MPSIVDLYKVSDDETIEDTISMSLNNLIVGFSNLKQKGFMFVEYYKMSSKFIGGLRILQNKGNAGNIMFTMMRN